MNERKNGAEPCFYQGKEKTMTLLFLLNGEKSSNSLPLLNFLTVNEGAKLE